MSTLEQGEIMMPITEEHALRQFEIEALRQITDNLKRMNEKMDRQAEKMDRQTESIHNMDTRLVRMESNKVDVDIAEQSAALIRVKARLEELEKDKFRREGAVSALEWVFKNWPGVLGFFGLIVLILGLTGKLKGVFG